MEGAEEEGFVSEVKFLEVDEVFSHLCLCPNCLRSLSMYLLDSSVCPYSFVVNLAIDKFGRMYDNSKLSPSTTGGVSGVEDF